LWWLQKLIPRNKNVWVFGAWYGRRFSDNSRYLYEYVRKNHPEIKAIWLTRDDEIKDAIEQKGGLAFLTNSMKGICYSLIAKNILVSSGKRDVNALFINGANWIQLWHGSPAKKIGLDDKYANSNSFFQEKVVKPIFPFLSEFTNYRIASNSPVFSKILSSAFGIPLSRIMETGTPRNDVYYSKKEDDFNLALREKFHGCKLIYYLPTFRDFEGAKSLFTTDDYDEAKLLTFLEEHNYVLVSKGHYVDNQLAKKSSDSHSRLVHLADKEVSDINFMLKDADLLITDYSSAYYDFLLTEKPIIFAAFDLKEYLAGSREMYFTYEDIVAGPIVKDWAALFQSLETIWEDDTYQTLIKEKNKVFNKYHDANNSKRVFDTISNL